MSEAGLLAFCRQALTTTGLDDDDAAVLAEALVAADLRGVETHGVVLLPNYVRRLRAGGIDPRAKARIVQESPVSALLDASHGAGHVVAVRAMGMAVAKAEAAGVGIVSVRDSNHIGMLAHYTTMAARHGLVGMAASNGSPVMPPWGGTEPFFGTNPISIAVPAEPDPIVLDMATAAVARGQIRKALRAGQPIPDGWATGPNGRPTTDPDEAMRGLLLPLGGAKGYGLALVVELLTGVLSGAAWGPGVVNGIGNPDRPQRMGQLVLAFRADLFCPLDELRRRIDEMVARLKEVRRADGVREILAPGERGSRLARVRRERGIPIAPRPGPC